MAVDLRINVGHSQRRGSEQPQIGLGFERHRKVRSPNSLVRPNDVDVLDPERRALREPTLQANERTVAGLEKHRPRDEDTVLAPRREQHSGEAVRIDAARFEYVVIWRDRRSPSVALRDGAPLGVQHTPQDLVADETGSAFSDDLVPKAARRRVLDGGLEPAAPAAVLGFEPADRAITGLRVVLREKPPNAVVSRFGNIGSRRPNVGRDGEGQQPYQNASTLRDLLHRQHRGALGVPVHVVSRRWPPLRGRRSIGGGPSGVSVEKDAGLARTSSHGRHEKWCDLVVLWLKYGSHCHTAALRHSRIIAPELNLKAPM